MNSLTCYEHDIHSVDAGYVRPLLAAVHLIVEEGRVAIVDSGSNAAVRPVLEALKALRLSPQAVDYLILTHIHLDHAGGAGSLMRVLPSARLLVHPRGVAHMVDPSRLVAGVTAVYGATAVRELYGEILPVAEARIIPATHGLRVDLAGRELLCLDTPGHARHHISVYDRRSSSFFTGDIFGLSYRELDRDGRQFIFPTTTPVQFDPVAMHASIDLLLSHAPQVMYLTHYSQVRDVAAKAVRLHELIDEHVRIARRAEVAGSGRRERIRAELQELLLAEAERFGCALPTARVLELFATDLDLNAQGLDVWLASCTG
ncbi:MBL fold metallo-hydrolase [Accumulibacter sp.]|uniref:MBL fold metallo-hydrolase n=1 Tax=Accumulibacter sp. TaxID=2053492 RepID=UPI0025E87B9D|nr:MBL fold metallo-hydrolase [Accumulibacter sp.]MCM8612967.1 MBL fold metallo-hydrolase [Accumulibacter sp.]MCM8636954.1 MBL fold metallo-hydrolase [Accumulibacter sp.]MCM8639274.1 MBL fold metallo-hydrolase [Accumulibacter sp.]